MTTKAQARPWLFCIAAVLQVLRQKQESIYCCYYHICMTFSVLCSARFSIIAMQTIISLAPLTTDVLQLVDAVLSRSSFCTVEQLLSVQPIYRSG